MRVRSWLVVCTLYSAALSLIAQRPPSSKLQWIPWSDNAFAQARQEHKFVLLDLEAVWCHWCHVMDDITYRDPDVVRLLNARYILVKVDQDSRPDISNRYQDYGWPATVVFNGDGSEIVKRQGYIPPRPMASMLQAIIDDPSPGPSVEREKAVQFATRSVISPALLAEIQKSYEAQYDVPAGGWGFSHKYLDGDSVEYAMRLAAHGDSLYQKRSQETLRSSMKLIDPIWGGAYQYSVGGNWDEPHFEKLILIQSQFIREFSLAYALWHEKDYARVAQSVHFYVHTFLTDPATGAFYVSQDADLTDGEENASYFKLNDKNRRSKGVPRVDKHIYARENGWMIASLCQLYADTGDATALSEAQRAATWIMANRELAGGGFRHDARDAAGPFLGDSLAMGQALVALYSVTGERRWLDAAEKTRHFIETNFAPRGSGGYITAATRTNASYRQHPDRDENISLVRFANMLYHYRGSPADRTTADHAMRYLATKEVALQPLSAGVLLVQDEFNHEPLHVAVIGRRGDAAAAALYQTALLSFTSYERLEWRDPEDKAPMATDVTYPTLDRAAAFLCTASACSSPVFQPSDLNVKIHRAETAKGDR